LRIALIPTPPVTLGAVERNIGVPQKIPGFNGIIGIDGHADTHPDIESMTLHHEGFGKHIDQLLRDDIGAMTIR
jgi:hypothetical protein